MTLLSTDAQPTAANKIQTLTPADKTQGVSSLALSRPSHPLGRCGEALGVSLPDDIEWRIRRIANDEGKTVSRFLCDLLSMEFATAHEKSVLQKHGRIVERDWSDYTGSNSEDGK